jgi:hypothetical protein
MHAFSWNTLKNGKIWNNSNQYGIIAYAHFIFAPWLLVIGAIQIVYATFTSFINVI